MRNRLSLVVCAVLMLILPLRAQASSCDPQPENQSVYALSWNQQFVECQPWQPCWAPFFARVEAAAKKSPDDVVIGMMHQQMAARLGPEKANAMREGYLARARREPNNPAAQYLGGMASVRGDEALELLDRARKLDPSFGRAYGQIAQRVFQVRSSQDQKSLWEKFGTPEENVAKFVQHCPGQPALHLQFVEVGDLEFWNMYASNGRELIERYELPRSVVRYLDALTSLWALEARILPPAEAKSRLAADLRLLTNFSRHQGRSFDIVDAMASGHKRLGDFQTEEALRDEILKRFPCGAWGTNNALRVRSDRYWIANGGRKSPLGMSDAEARKYYDTLRGWMNTCPNRGDTYYSSLVPTVYRLGVSGLLSPAELAEEEAFIKSRWERLRPYQGSYAPQSADYIFGMIRLRTGQRPTEADVLSLRRLQQDMLRWRTNSLMAGWLSDSLPKEQELNKIGEAAIDVQVASVLARVLAGRGDIAAARATLDELQDRVRFLESHLTNKEAYGVTAGLSHYWLGRALVSDGWDKYAYLQLANALQSSEGIDHDPTIAQEVDRLASLLKVPADALAAWQGSPEGREALSQSMKLASAESETVKNNVWRELKTPLALPAVELKDLKGQVTTLAELTRDRAVLVNFWATWCGPCQLELPLLTQVAKTAPPGAIVTVSVDADFGEVDPYLAKRKLELPIVLFGEKLFRDLTQHPEFKAEVEWAVPQSWIVRNGSIISIITGFDAKVPADKWIAETLAHLAAASK